MQHSKISFRYLLFMLAAALLSALVFISAPKVHAAADEGIIVSDSDALIAAISDPSCDKIILQESQYYSFSETVEINHSITLIGSSSSLGFSDGAHFYVARNAQLTLSGLTMTSEEDYSLVVNGSVTFSDAVSFDGKRGIKLNPGSVMTSENNAVSAASALEVLVFADASSESVALSDIRLTQANGTTDMLVLANGSGSLGLSGNISIYAADGTAIFCAAEETGPEISVKSNTILSVSAPNAALNQELDVPGSAIDVRTCALNIGSGASLGLTGSYSCIAAGSVYIGENASVNAVCKREAESKSVRCSAIYASGGIKCGSGVSVSAGASGGNFAGALFAESKVEMAENTSVLLRSNSDYVCAVGSAGAVTLSKNCSIVSRGGAYGFYCGDLEIGDNATIEISEISGEGICCSGSIRCGSSVVMDISAGSCAVYSKGSVSFNGVSEINLSSANDPVIWVDGSASDNLVLSGCKLVASANTAASSRKNAGVYVTGGITVDSLADVTVINTGDIGMLSAGGSVNVKGTSKLRCSGGIGILVSRGSVLLGEMSVLYAEGSADSAVRIEKGSFSATGEAVTDIQGARFGIEVLSGDIYIDGASYFDIRSTGERALFIENGRLTIINTERVSAWLRSENGANSERWWSDAPSLSHSWEITDSKNTSYWLYADYTALAPNLTQQHAQGIGQPAGFAWYNSEWSSVDYSRIGCYISAPVGRTNSFNIPAGKSFSWMLFGASYDNTLRFRLNKSSGDGTFDLREDGTFSYTSLAYSRGVQSFDFVVENGDGAVSEPVTVNILVTASKPPVASSTTFPVKIDEDFIGQVSVFDYDGTISSIKVVDQPQHGTAIINSEGMFSYQAEPGFIGIDTFTFVAEDNMGDQSDLGYISLAVGMTDSIAVCNSTIVTQSGVEESTRFAALLGEETVDPAPEFVIVTPPVYGTLYFDTTEPAIVTYVPYDDFSGTDVFSYAAINPDGTLTETAYITIATVPSQRPTAQSASFVCTKNSSCEGKLYGYDVDGTIYEFTLAEQPSSGIIELDPASGAFTYYPERGFVGEVQFSFTVTDSDGLISEPVSVVFRVVSLIDTLKETGRFGTAIVLCCIVLAVFFGIVALIIYSAARNRRERDYEKEKSRLFEYSGSNDSYYDDRDRYNY